MDACGPLRAPGVPTTFLTATASDNLPFDPILQVAHCQVGQGMPQPARFFQAWDHERYGICCTSKLST